MDNTNVNLPKFKTADQRKSFEPPPKPSEVPGHFRMSALAEKFHKKLKKKKPLPMASSEQRAQLSWRKFKQDLPVSKLSPFEQYIPFNKIKNKPSKAGNPPCFAKVHKPGDLEIEDINASY